MVRSLTLTLIYLLFARFAIAVHAHTPSVFVFGFPSYYVLCFCLSFVCFSFFFFVSLPIPSCRSPVSLLSAQFQIVPFLLFKLSFFSCYTCAFHAPWPKSFFPSIFLLPGSTLSLFLSLYVRRRATCFFGVVSIHPARSLCVLF